MTSSLATVPYIGATILHPQPRADSPSRDQARRGNLFGIAGMSIAVLATVFGPQVGMGGIPWIVIALVIGAAVGPTPRRRADDADA